MQPALIWARTFIYVSSVCSYMCLLCVKGSKGSGETVRMRKLVWAFTAHKFISTWPK